MNRILGIILLLYFLTGCTTFERNEPSPVGTFYPNQPIRHVSFTKDNFWNSPNVISFSKPAEIKAVGKMTWNSLMGDYYETALISPKLDHLQGDYWIDTDGDYYATISWLQANGRIEYTGSKTSVEYFWEGGWGMLIKILFLVILGYLGYRKIKKYFEAEASKRVSEKNQKQEEEKSKIKEAQITKEKEFQRRKDIVLDIINNLYKETESEISKTPIPIPILIDELYDIFNKLHSENLNDVIINSSLTEYNNIINPIKSELNRLKELALDAQSKGHKNK